MIATPLWITNFKNYENAIGQKALEMAKLHEQVAKSTGKNIAIAVPVTEVYRIAKEVNIPVFSQHVDGVDYGKFTGSILPQAVKKSGAVGSLLNHSERRIEPELIAHTVSCAQKAGLSRIICAENPDEVEMMVEFEPDAVAFEPPELIGATHTSVSSQEPASIRESVQRSRGIPIFVGAGINCRKDVEVALTLGAKGFLVATAIMKAKDPAKALTELVGPL